MGRINKSFSSAAYYGVEKEQAAALFQYYISTQRQNFERTLSIYNFATKNSMRKVNNLAVPGIKTKQVFFVPMIAKLFTLEESALYDGLTDEQFEQIRANPEQLDLQNKNTLYHINKERHDETTHVKVRLLCPHSLPVNFSTRNVDQ